MLSININTLEFQKEKEIKCKEIEFYKCFYLLGTE